LDEELLANPPVNSDDPQFLASEVFRDTLLSFGLDEDTANNARRLFLAVKKDKLEETQNAFFRVASQLNNSGKIEVDEKQKDFSFMEKEMSIVSKKAID